MARLGGGVPPRDASLPPDNPPPRYLLTVWGLAGPERDQRCSEWRRGWWVGREKGVVQHLLANTASFFSLAELAPCRYLRLLVAGCRWPFGSVLMVLAERFVARRSSSGHQVSDAGAPTIVHHRRRHSSSMTMSLALSMTGS